MINNLDMPQSSSELTREEIDKIILDYFNLIEIKL